MRALRVVGILEDGGEFTVVLEDSERRERFTVPADERLRAAARGDLTRLGQIAIEAESQLRPREIQARIRAGASVEQVAAMAGAPLQKIERFAYPVLLERSRTAEVAQRAHPMRADGPDSRMLGDVVAHTFGLRGQEYADVEWDSWKGEDGKWVVALSWSAGHSDIRAHWVFHPGANGGTVTALDENASDLVEGLPARPLRPVGPVIDMSRQDNGGRELAESAGWASPVGPAPGPVPELRAAASDSGRRGPEPGFADPTHHPRAAVERPPTRAAAEPRRPAPPTQRQTPVEPRTSAGVGGGEAERRPAEPYQAQVYPQAPEHRSEYRPEQQPTPYRPEQRPAEYRPAERGVGEPRPAAPPQPEPQSRPEPVRPAARTAPEPAAPQPPAVEPQAVEPETPQQPVEPRSTEPAPQPAPEPGTAAAATPEPPAAEPSRAPDKPEPARPAAAKRTKKGKPVMPSWDEVLLGVRGPR